jgi:NADH-quinone oxidoreductase subunit C
MTPTPTLEALHMAFTELLAPGTEAAVSPASDLATAGSESAGSLVGVVAPASATSPCQLTDPRKKGWHLDVRVSPEQVVEAARLVDRQGFAIDTVTGVDWLAAGEMEVVYDFFHPTLPLRIVIRTRVPRSKPEVPTISEVFPGANWHERETHDFFGIVFLGHPDLSPLLLPEDADFHPLRKDFPGVT